MLRSVNCSTVLVDCGHVDCAHSTDDRCKFETCSQTPLMILSSNSRLVLCTRIHCCSLGEIGCDCIYEVTKFDDASYEVMC